MLMYSIVKETNPNKSCKEILAPVTEQLWGRASGTGGPGLRAIAQAPAQVSFAGVSLRAQAGSNMAPNRCIYKIEYYSKILSKSLV